MLRLDYPLEFTNLLKKGTHVLLIYEDESRANKIRLEFIKKGLTKNESCVYLTTEHDKKLFEKNLIELGVNLDKFQAKNKFKIFQIPNPFTSNGGFGNSINKIWEEITNTFHSPMRIVCNIVGDVSQLSNDQLKNLLTTENCIHQDFSKSEDYLLCTYNIGKINSKTSYDFLNRYAFPLASRGIEEPSGC